MGVMNNFVYFFVVSLNAQMETNIRVVGDMRHHDAHVASLL